MAKKKKARKGAQGLIVASKVKAYIKAKGCMTSKDALEALDLKLQDALDQAVDRTKANKRLTVKPQDI